MSEIVFVSKIVEHGQFPILSRTAFLERLDGGSAGFQVEEQRSWNGNNCEFI